MKDKIFYRLQMRFTSIVTWLKNDVAFVFFAILTISLFAWNLLDSTHEDLFSLAFLGTTSFIVFYFVFHLTSKKFNQNFRQLNTETNIQLSIAGLFGLGNTTNKPTDTQKIATNETIPLYPLAKGKLKDIEEIDDDLYSKKTLGTGFAVTPVEGKVHSPVNGKIVSLFPTKHAIGIKDENDIEYLVHMGIDTIDLNGHGFQTFVEQDQEVKAGDLLTEMDLDYISAHRKTTDIIFITLSQDLIDSLEVVEDKPVGLDESIGRIVLK